MRLLAIITLALLATACGSSGPKAAQTSNNPATAAYQYAACIRHHGVPSFPDPKVSGNSIAQEVPASAGLSPAFQAAQKACAGIMKALAAGPSQADRQAKKQYLLAFAHCLRGHGVAGFPDPTSHGQLSMQMINAAGVDLHAPSFYTAARACVGVTHGAITLADVARAINGPH
ncbi:MAG TPA: hypothetical protein VKT31_09485 [Solirubrobacteraceae bacterium]|nr:hypothetical protein [Solirubrobacteraceae bacterium]